MGVRSLGSHTRPTCHQGSTRSIKLCKECGSDSCVRVFFILWGSRGQKQWVVTSISHMGEMRDSDWSRPNLLRSDWLPIIVASMTTYTQAAIVNNTKRSSPGKGKWSLKLVAIEIEPRPFFRTRSFRQSWRWKDARSETADISVKTLQLFEMGWDQHCRV